MWWPTVLWSTLVNFGLLMQTVAAPNLIHQQRFPIDYRKCHAKFSNIFASRVSLTGHCIGHFAEVLHDDYWTDSDWV
jgi:hypothetical protein